MLDSGNWIFVIGMGLTTIIYGIIVYMFAVKKKYFLLNGYAGRSAEEKKYLQTSGYLQANGKLLLTSFWVLFASFLLGLIGIPYGFELGMALFVILLFIGLFWVQRYEVPHKRKRMRWITGVLVVVTIGFIIWIINYSFKDNTFIITDETFEVAGSYSIEWDIEDIQNIQLLNELPTVRIKTNGTNIGGMFKGKFRLEEPYGTGRLYIQNNYETTKVLYIETTEDFIMISRNTDNETIALYEELKSTLE